MKCDKKMMLLYAVTDQTWTQKLSLYEQVEAALQGGVTCVQLREKNLSDENFLEEAVKICELCHRYGIPFIINDHVEIAVKCSADGIHVGQEDAKVLEVRNAVGEDMIIGVSVHTVNEAVEAVKQGADYLGVGAVFSTTTKTDVSVLSHEMLRDICSAVEIPVVAIGGIQKENMEQLSGSGIDGVALVSAIFSADAISEECRELHLLAERVVRK
ncbi:MAG: thiamine phosphate synthase [Lachnospiraceae bacterium]